MTRTMLTTMLQIFAVGVHTTAVGVTPENDDEMLSDSVNVVPEYDVNMITELDSSYFDKACEFVISNPFLAFSILGEQSDQSEDVGHLVASVGDLYVDLGPNIFSSGMKYTVEMINKVYESNNSMDRGCIMPLIVSLKEAKKHMTDLESHCLYKDVSELSKDEALKALLTEVTDSLSAAIVNIYRLQYKIGEFQSAEGVTIGESMMAVHSLFGMAIVFEVLEGLRLYFNALLVAVEDNSEIAEARKLEHTQCLLKECFLKFVAAYQYYSFIVVPQRGVSGVVGNPQVCGTSSCEVMSAA